MKWTEYYLVFIAQWTSYLMLDLHFNSNTSLQIVIEFTDLKWILIISFKSAKWDIFHPPR